MNRFDFIVVGTGPAGCTAAFELAKGGARVALVDQETLPRYKTCGGGLLSRAHRFLSTSTESAVERSCTSMHLHILNQNLHFVANRATPIVYMTMRADLDMLLMRQATAEGAQLLAPVHVSNIARKMGSVELDTSIGRVSASAVILADGAASKLARAAGWGDSPHRVPALEYEITVPRQQFERRATEARFDFGVNGSGYAWVFPKRSHLSVGILATRPGAGNLRQELGRYLLKIGIDDITSCHQHGYVIPLAPRLEPLASGAIFLTGDAAGLADPVTAEGITHAILSGQLAARALLSTTSVTEAAICYQSLVETQILAELRAARLFARFLYGWPRLRDLAFRRAGQRLCEFMTDVVTGDRCYRDALRKPSNLLTGFGLWH